MRLALSSKTYILLSIFRLLLTRQILILRTFHIIL
nr:MAG TPA: hypothetical protein [Caudoviricetes sp.]